jgi:ABC-type microcin C transport system permease subunit YejE
MHGLIEIWDAVPELYLLIIFASIFEPSLLLLLVLLSLFGWIGLSDYVRAEFLRNRRSSSSRRRARWACRTRRSSGATCCPIR